MITPVLIGAASGAAVAPALCWAITRTSRRPWRPGIGYSAAVVVAAAAAGGWAAGWAPTDGAVVAWWALLVGGVALAVVDLREHRLPSPLIVATALGVIGSLTAAASLSGEWSRWGLAMAAATAAFAMSYLWALLSGMGFGDVKLTAVIAGVAGYTSIATAATALVAGIALGGIAAALQLATGADRQRAMAMGPWLLLGAAASLPWAG